MPPNIGSWGWIFRLILSKPSLPLHKTGENMSEKNVTEPLLAYRALPPKNGGAPDFIVVLLHGVGSNGADLLDLAWHWRDVLPQTEFISVDGPDAYDLAPHSALAEFSARQWFSLAGIYDPIAGVRTAIVSEMRQRAEKNLPIVQGFLAQILAARHLPASRLALVGFSQGSMMSLATALDYSPSLAGVVGYSGMLMAKSATDLKDKTRLPILLIHGQDDPVVPFSAMTSSGTILRDAGFDVTTLPCANLGHSIDMQGLKAGGDFLAKLNSDYLYQSNEKFKFDSLLGNINEFIPLLTSEELKLFAYDLYQSNQNHNLDSLLDNADDKVNEFISYYNYINNNQIRKKYEIHEYIGTRYRADNAQYSYQEKLMNFLKNSIPPLPLEGRIEKLGE